ncbi:MAG TPA: HAMP domain-containing sensor histidine kinase [Vicinamibacterales bacterium]|jgi:signal transduction histidine kinase
MSRRDIRQSRAQQLQEALRLSAEAVRRAHVRAEEAARRAREIRGSSATLRKIRTNGRERGKIQLVIEESERASREKERFIAVVSHELRQPLNAILGAFTLLDEAIIPAVQERARRVMDRQLRQMVRLLDDLLDMSRLSVRTLKLDVARQDLQPILEASLETIAARVAERRLRLDVGWTPEPLFVEADACRLQQVFGNLLSNAVRYTPEGGSIVVSLARENGSAAVCVTDTGVGIEKREMENIFEPFARGGSRSPEGFGIGLALVKGLVELHGGTVTVASGGRDKGSAFTVFLPLR